MRWDGWQSKAGRLGAPVVQSARVTVPGYGRVMTTCSHINPANRYDDGPTIMGRQICKDCGAQRLFEGDHLGEWSAPGEEPNWGGYGFRSSGESDSDDSANNA